MAEIEPEGLPAVKLQPLLSLKNSNYLSDDTYYAEYDSEQQMTGIIKSVLPDFSIDLLNLNIDFTTLPDFSIDLLNIDFPNIISSADTVQEIELLKLHIQLDSIPRVSITSGMNILQNHTYNVYFWVQVSPH